MKIVETLVVEKKKKNYNNNSNIEKCEKGEKEEKGDNKQRNDISVQAFVVTFSEMCTYVLKHICLVSVANYFYIFVALVKFVERVQTILSQKVKEEEEEKEKETETDKAQKCKQEWEQEQEQEQERENIKQVNLAKKTDPRIYLFYLIHIIREFEYKNVKTILNDPDNRNYFLYEEKKSQWNKQIENIHFEKLHENILEYFQPNCITLNEWGYPNQELEKAVWKNMKNVETIQNGETVINMETVKNVDSQKMEQMGSHLRYVEKENGTKKGKVEVEVEVKDEVEADVEVKRDTNILGENILRNICLNSYHYIVTILNNYLDFSKFDISKFLISLFYLNQLLPKHLKEVSHLESRIKRNQQHFLKRHFYIFNGLNEEEPNFLKQKKYINLVLMWERKKYEKQQKNEKNIICDIYTNNIIDQWKCNIYDVVENIFQKKKILFSFNDTLNFLFIYSMSGLYNSDLFYIISKFLYDKHDITSIINTEKTLLFFLLCQCKNCYSPFFFSLLSEVLKIEEQIEQFELAHENDLYILCALLITLIKNSKIKKKQTRAPIQSQTQTQTHVHIYNETHGMEHKIKHKMEHKEKLNYLSGIYVKNKLGKFDFNYFFPLKMFYHKNVFVHIKNKIQKMEEEDVIMEKKSKTNFFDTQRKETINFNKKFIRNLQYFEKDFMRVIPILLQKCKRKIEGRIEQTHFEEYKKREIQYVVTEKQNNCFNKSLLYFYFDKTSEIEILENIKNFLSYDWVINNFRISKKSLYFKLLLYIQMLKHDKC